MDFKVVEIPSTVKSNNFYKKLIDTLVENLGKAVEVPLENRSVNAFRGSIRAHLARSGQNKFYSFHSTPNGTSITMWLEKIEVKE